MSLPVIILIAFIAVQHIGFLLLEMFLWTQPVGRRVFRTTETFARESRALAANQGLYNGFLAAGLLWSLWLEKSGPMIAQFFLFCVLIAGVFGGLSVSRRILWIQALPAALTLLLMWAAE